MHTFVLEPRLIYRSSTLWKTFWELLRTDECKKKNIKKFHVLLLGMGFILLSGSPTIRNGSFLISTIISDIVLKTSINYQMNIKFFLTSWLQKKLLNKVHIFWEGHKILRNLPCRFVLCSNSQIYGRDFAKFCGLLRIYEL